METLKFEQDGHVGWLRLNRPEKLNAMTVQMWAEMRELGQQLLADAAGLRCLVVIGEGRAFSAGIDLSTFSEGQALDPGPVAERAVEDEMVAGILRAQEAFTWLEDASFPTIAALRGYALGAGIQLAMACDLRIVARGTRLGVFEQKYGILPDLGGTHWLPRLVGPARAKELTWTVAEIDAEEAHRIGLCEHLVDDADLEKVAEDLAATIAAQPPLAVAGAKAAINRAAHGESREAVLRETAERQAECLRSKDFAEAITAFLEGRPPEYQGA
ncbi:MAG: enoyl-CoA hydratase/isomerase family protein [Actinobacteria bacterium]|nr:enoyl-CoA hydratase/isomerase family protein [Actinomycetota bacterium]